MAKTATDLINLYGEKKQRDIENYFDSISEKAFKKSLDRNIRDCPHNLPTIVKAYFYGSPNNNDGAEKRRQFIYEAVFGILQQNLSSQMGSDLIGILQQHIDELSAESLANLAMKKLEILRSSSVSCERCLELLPKLISTIASKDEISYCENLISGEEFKRHYLDDLCSVKWNPQNATLLATVFREIPMSHTELQFVVEKLIRLLKMMDLSETPSFIYQLLLLSSKVKDLNQTVLQSIVTVYSTQTENTVEDENDLEEIGHSKEEFRRIEGTAILHITYAMRQDQELAKEFLKFLKSNQHNPKNILVPFTIALGLATIRFESFKITTLDLFKSAIVKNFKELEMKKSSNWFREMLPSNTDVTSVFLDVVKNSAYGWDYVTQGLVQLGFVLMEATTTKAVGRKPSESSETVVVQNPISDLGSTILLSVFKASDIVRSAILEQILNHIFNKDSLANQCINLLAQIVQTSPLFVLDSVSKIQQIISFLPMMSPTTAVNLVKALFSLLRINVPLKESIMLVLRKSLISGQLDSRKIAVKGYLHFLKNFKILGHLSSSQSQSQSQSSQNSWSSQINADIHTTLNPEMNEVLCLELLSTLTYALSQQAEIRQIIYNGLYTVLSKNTKMTLRVLELLKVRMDPYYQTNQNAQPPLKLLKIIAIQNEKTTLIEPLAMLLHCIQKCVLATNLRAFDDDDADSSKIQSCVHELESLLKSLSERMAAAELEDFELDKSADYSNATSVGQKNKELAVTILMIYEVLIEFLFSSEGQSVANSEKILKLFKNYKHLISILKDDNKKIEGKGAGRSATFKPPTCLMSIESISAFLNKLLLADDSEYTCLKGNEEFLRFLVGSVVQNIQENKTEEMDSDEANQYFTVVCQTASTLFQYYNSRGDVVTFTDKGKKVQFLHSFCLETFFFITTTVTTKYSHRVSEFINHLQGRTSFRNSQTQNRNDSLNIYHQVQTLQKCVDDILSQDEDARSLKDMIIFINMITTFSSRISPDEGYIEKILSWVQTIITDQTFGDVNTVKSLLQLFLNLLHQAKGKNTILRDLAQDVHSQLGDIDEEVQVEESKNFAIVTEQMSPTIRQLLLQHFELILTEVDWMLNFSKADLSSLQKIDMDDEVTAITQQENKDKIICNHLGLFLTVMHELVQTALPTGVAVDTLLKHLVHGYNTLNLFTKYYISMHTLKVGKCCARFEKLIKVSGTMLSPQVYALITYIQMMQNESQKEKEKKKRKVDSTLQKSKILRETRQVPPLIYAIEQFETSLMQLNKKSKVNFMQHVKLSTSRDFRINTNAMKAIESDNGEEEEESANIDVSPTSEIENEEPTIKKIKLSRGRKSKSK